METKYRTKQPRLVDLIPDEAKRTEIVSRLYNGNLSKVHFLESLLDMCALMRFYTVTYRNFYIKIVVIGGCFLSFSFNSTELSGVSEIPTYHIFV